MGYIRYSDSRNENDFKQVPGQRCNRVDQCSLSDYGVVKHNIKRDFPSEKGGNTMLNGKGILKFFAMVLLVMVGIFVVKKLTAKFNIPVVSSVAEAV